ncbi:hypothetical protein HDU93_005844 [Gonapodya sp. JEL0774]|nr:hypothetical protein HDU93_005844 [Gonapodya sp. JEL0774]
MEGSPAKGSEHLAVVLAASQYASTPSGSLAPGVPAPKAPPVFAAAESTPLNAQPVTSMSESLAPAPAPEPALGPSLPTLQQPPLLFSQFASAGNMLSGGSMQFAFMPRVDASGQMILVPVPIAAQGMGGGTGMPMPMQIPIPGGQQMSFGGIIGMGGMPIAGMPMTALQMGPVPVGGMPMAGMQMGGMPGGNSGGAPGRMPGLVPGFPQISQMPAHQLMQAGQFRWQNGAVPGPAVPGGGLSDANGVRGS